MKFIFPDWPLFLFVAVAFLAVVSYNRPKKLKFRRSGLDWSRKIFSPISGLFAIAEAAMNSYNQKIEEVRTFSCLHCNSKNIQIEEMEASFRFGNTITQWGRIKCLDCDAPPHRSCQSILCGL
jgi:hypothetical protein